MTTDNLIDIIDKNPSESKKYLHLLNAMNDWPIEVDSVSEYYLQVKAFLKISEVSLEKVEKKLRRKKVDLSKNNLWNLESISELILYLKMSHNNENRDIK